MKWHGRDVDRPSLTDIFRRRHDRVRSRDGIPDIGWFVVAELDAIGAARVRDRNQMTSGQRLDRRRCFLNSFVPQNTQVHLAIRGRVLAKDGGPIDVPVNEERVRIARDGEEKRSAVGAWKFSEIFVVRGHRVVRRGGRPGDERARR